jgi:uncharacterized membrane protein YbhN (UPF0104 family)
VTVIPADVSRRPRWLLPAIWAILTAAIAIALSRVSWQDALRHVARANPGWVTVAVLANFAILPLWALEWRLLAPVRPPVPFRRMFEIVALTAAVLNSVPMLAGEVSAVALLTTRAGLSAGAAVSVLAMDQLLVALAKVAVLSAAAIAAPLPDWLARGMLGLAMALVAGCAILLVLAHRWEALRERFGRERVGAVMRRVVSWGEHLAVLRDPGLSISVAALALVKKLAEVGAVVAIQLAFGLPASLPTALLAVAALSIATLVPIAPANLGVYEATLFAVYRLTGTSADIALGIAVVQHLCFLLPSLLPGYLMLTVRPLATRARRGV